MGAGMRGDWYQEGDGFGHSSTYWIKSSFSGLIWTCMSYTTGKSPHRLMVGCHGLTPRQGKKCSFSQRKLWRLKFHCGCFGTAALLLREYIRIGLHWDHRFSWPGWSWKIMLTTFFPYLRISSSSSEVVSSNWVGRQHDNQTRLHFFGAHKSQKESTSML